MPARAIRFALGASVLVGLLTATHASAAIDEGTYSLLNPEVEVADNQADGAQFNCPTGQNIVAEGFFWHAAGQGPDPGNAEGTRMASNFPTTTGMFSSGFKAPVGPLFRQSVLLCLPSSVIGTPYTTVSADSAALTGAAGGYLSCPTGHRVISGGAYWHISGQGPSSAAAQFRISSSTPTTDARGWYAEGFNGTASPDRVFTILAHCLPSAGFGPYSVVTQTSATVNPPVDVDDVAGGYVPCPAGQRIVGGGAFWHEPGQGPTINNAQSTSLSSSTPTTDARGWYADGLDITIPRQLTTVLLCITPVVPAAPVTPVAPATVPAATPTGQRAAAIKKCKKKFPKGTKKRKKCLKRARLLPV